MSLFEFQMSTSQFLVAQRNYLRLRRARYPELPHRAMSTTSLTPASRR
jgi:hypothetical protein